MWVFLTSDMLRELWTLEKQGIPVFVNQSRGKRLQGLGIGGDSARNPHLPGGKGTARAFWLVSPPDCVPRDELIMV